MMTNNDFGEPMEFKPALPIVNARQLAQVVEFTKSVNPESASFEDIEAVFAWIGRCLTMPCPVPAEAVEWAIQVSRMRLLTCEIICQGVVANAQHIQAKRFDSALFALVALRDFSGPNARTFQQLTQPAGQPDQTPEEEKE